MNGKKILLIPLVLLLIFSCTKNYVPPVIPINSDTVSDTDGNVYHTVTIGTQVWMVENLKTTKYNNGTPIPNVTNSANWNGLTTGAYCDYENIPSNSNTYGKLYNWYATTNPLSICPRGWHIPSQDEWNTLANYLHGTEYAAGPMKEAGTAHWQSPNIGATNQTNFTALPGGDLSSGTFGDIGYIGVWWTSTEYDTANAYVVAIFNDETEMMLNHGPKTGGLSIRCIKN